jgi:hypothetical protein
MLFADAPVADALVAKNKLVAKSHRQPEFQLKFWLSVALGYQWPEQGNPTQPPHPVIIFFSELSGFQALDRPSPATKDVSPWAEYLMHTAFCMLQLRLRCSQQDGVQHPVHGQQHNLPVHDLPLHDAVRPHQYQEAKEPVPQQVAL